MSTRIHRDIFQALLPLVLLAAAALPCLGQGPEAAGAPQVAAPLAPAPQAAEAPPAAERAEPAPAGEPMESAADEEAELSGAIDYSLIQLVQFGGVVGYVIIVLSMATVALIVDDALLLRDKVLVPPKEIEELRELVAGGRYDQVTGEPRASFVGAVTAAGVAERERGYEAVVKAMEDRGDELTGRLLRRIEYLNMIANVAPMLGLLGTVIGMVACFNQISVAAGGADPRLLAAGIFQALMTTVMGLIVAIPAFFAFSIFRNRVDAMVAGAFAVAEDLVSPLRGPRATEPRATRLSRA